MSCGAEAPMLQSLKTHRLSYLEQCWVHSEIQRHTHRVPAPLVVSPPGTARPAVSVPRLGTSGLWIPKPGLPVAALDFNFGF